MTIKQMLNKMSVIDKATCINLLMIMKFPATPLEGIDIGTATKTYNKSVNILIDQYLWRLYGLHYKEFLGHIAGAYIFVDPIKLEKALDKSIIYRMSETFPELAE